MKRIFLLLLIFCTALMSSYGQASVKPSDLVKNHKIKYRAHTVAPLYATAVRNVTVPSELKNYQILDLDRNILSDITARNSSFIEMDIPMGNTMLELELVQVDIMRGQSHIVALPSHEEVEVDYGKHYQGIIKGNNNSLVAISVFDNQVEGFISDDNTNLILGKLTDQDAHIIYESKDLDHLFELGCEADDSQGSDYTDAELRDVDHQSRDLSECVELFIEVDYDIFQNKGGTNGTTSYVTGLLNQVITLYANENINCSLLPLNIWTSSSPYSGNDSSSLLSQFQNNNNTWQGTLAQLLSYKASGGIAAGFSGICNSNRDNSMSFSSIQSSYSNVPTYSWSVMVVTHEFGHIFGSRHTHACVWNGNNTAIDACAGSTEGYCSSPPNPSDGGTIMSYCHLQSVGINFNKGFGPQPGNVIRNRVANGSCTVSCDGGGGGGGGSCTDNQVIVNITTDNYGSETSWSITDNGGSTVASGSGYSNNTTYNIEECLPDGCYTFTISDSYGDGICCQYGSGSYSVAGPDGSIASGGQFTFSEATDFCFGGGSGDIQPPSAPTFLNASNTTTTSTELSWNASTDNVGVTGYEIFSNGSSLGTTTGTSVNVTGLTESTTYTFTVEAFDAAGNQSSSSNSIQVTTPSDSNPPVSYCSLSGDNSSFEWIDYVGLNLMMHTSGNDGGYADNTDMIANISYGTNTIYVSAGFSGSSYREYWSVWIDFNQDGTFSSSERIVYGNSTSSALLSGQFTVPSTALPGQTRMRVAMKYNTSNSSSCGTFNYGEVEDYTVDIGTTSIIENNYIPSKELGDEDIESTSVYPNPVMDGNLFVELHGIEKADFNLVNTVGQIVRSGQITARDHRINVSDIETGIYMIQLNDGQKNFTHKVMIR